MHVKLYDKASYRPLRSALDRLLFVVPTYSATQIFKFGNNKISIAKWADSALMVTKKDESLGHREISNHRI